LTRAVCSCADAPWTRRPKATFPATVGAEEGDELAWADLEAHVVHDAAGAEILDEVLYPDSHHLPLDV
jgi:hypothetical protein